MPGDDPPELDALLAEFLSRAEEEFFLADAHSAEDPHRAARGAAELGRLRYLAERLSDADWCMTRARWLVDHPG